METLSALRKQGTLKLPNGGTLTRDGRAVVYEGTQKVRVVLPQEAADDAARDRPMVTLMESVTGLKCADVVKRIAQLTPREIEVLNLMIGDGVKNRQIAERLGISPKTLDIHRANIGRKLALRTMNAWGRLYFLFRVCNELYPNILADAREAKRIADEGI